MKHALIVLLSTAISCAAFDLQEAIDTAKSGSTVTIPAGSYTQPIRIKKSITLKGADAVLEVVSNKPAILIDCSSPVTFEGITIRYKTAGQPEKGDTPYAVFVRAGKVSLKNCTFKALGSGAESPSAISAQEKSEVEIAACSFDGFEYTIQFWNESKGRIENCIVMNSGRCGITIGKGSKVDLEQNIITGSRFHGIRCTGGEISARSNLVIRNRNRGFYIGNKSAIGEISNNLIAENATGISVFARSKIAIENNTIIRSSYAGLSVIDTAKLDIENNIIAENGVGIVGGSAEKGREPSISLRGKNLVYGNKADTEKVTLSSRTVKEEPEFKDPKAGLFDTAQKGMGLENPKQMQQLWNKWQAALDPR